MADETCKASILKKRRHRRRDNPLETTLANSAIVHERASRVLLTMKSLTSVSIRALGLRRNELAPCSEPAFKAESKISGACCRFAVANHQLFDSEQTTTISTPVFRFQPRSFGHRVQIVESTKWPCSLCSAHRRILTIFPIPSSLPFFVAIIFTRLVIFTIGAVTRDAVNAGRSLLADFAKTRGKRRLRETPSRDRFPLVGIYSSIRAFPLFPFLFSRALTSLGSCRSAQLSEARSRVQSHRSQLRS